MSEALSKIEDFRLQVLKDLYNQCYPEQQELFKSMYFHKTRIVEWDKMPKDKINWAIQQCELTIKRNKDGTYKPRAEVKANERLQRG